MRFVHKLAGMTQVVVRRLHYHAGLSLLAFSGVVLAIGLVTSASFFAQAVDTVILRNQMAEYTVITGRPPFYSRVFSTSSTILPLSLERVERLNAQLADTFSREIGLPAKQVTFQANSDRLELRAPDDEYGHDAQDLNVVYLNDVADHITIVEGDGMDTAGSGGRLPLWIHPVLADDTGLQVGEEYNLGLDSSQTIVPARIAGIWRPTDAEDPYWINDPDRSLGDKLLVRREDYIGSLEPLLEHKVRSATWQIVLDENAVLPANVRDYLVGYTRANVLVQGFLPDAQITTPTVSLDEFVDRQTSLTTLLLGFNIPGFGFLLYFLVLTSVIIAYWQRRELLVMFSRGMTRWDVLQFTVIDTVILFLIGLPFGLALGGLLARAMGYASSFLIFSLREPLPISRHGGSVTLVVLTFLTLLIARVAATAQGDWHRLLEEGREHYRPQRAPFWYRSYLDILLLAPVWYAYQQLLNRGSLAQLVEERPEDLFRDPLLLLAPALFIAVLSLVTMRLFHLAMTVLERLTRWIQPMPAYMALRQLSRQSHTYINPLLLVVISLALGVYTLSMAASLDGWLLDRIYYQTGADLTVEPFQAGSAVAGEDALAGGGEWIPPVDEFAALPGVTAAARVGDYQAELAVGDDRLPVRFLAIDRIDFDKVAWFRSDFATEPLGALMNRLALTPNSVLVSSQLVDRYGLRIGDQLPISIFPEAGIRTQPRVLVGGVYTFFPTVYQDQETVIGNLDLLTSEFGLTMAHDIWLRLDTAADGQLVIDEIESSLHVDTINRRIARLTIQEELARMERVGVFGTLSVSFIAATLMAALGLLTYSYASLEERRHQLAVMRAIGTTGGQVIRQVSIEYLVLIVFGGIVGVAVGMLAAGAFVPLFRIADGLEAPLPPLIPILAFDSVIPLTAIFVAVMVIMQLLLIAITLQSRLYAALRM